MFNRLILDFYRQMGRPELVPTNLIIFLSLLFCLFFGTIDNHFISCIIFLFVTETKKNLDKRFKRYFSKMSRMLRSVATNPGPQLVLTNLINFVCYLLFLFFETIYNHFISLYILYDTEPKQAILTKDLSAIIAN